MAESKLQNSIVYKSGSKTISNNTLTTICNHVFSHGTWMIFTTLKTVSGAGSGLVNNVGQNRIIKDGTLVYSSKTSPDVSLVNTNFYVLTNANNTDITFEAFQGTGVTIKQEYTFTAIRIK